MGILSNYPEVPPLFRRYLNVAQVWLIVGAIGHQLSDISVAAPSLPQSPIQPTRADCTALHNAYSEIARAESENVSLCLKGPPNIGQGVEIDWYSGNDLSCRTHEATRAWPQCASQELDVCEVWAHQRAEVKVCESRMRNGSESTLKSINDGYDLTKKTALAFKNTVNFISDPKRAIFETLNDKSKNIALRLFDPEGHLRENRFEDANEIYRFAMNVSRTGLGSTRNGIVREIQLSALSQISATFSNVFSQFDDAIHTFNDQTADGQSVRLPIQYQNRRPVAPSTDGCAILSDHTASEKLMTEDQGRWLALVGACTK